MHWKLRLESRIWTCRLYVLRKGCQEFGSRDFTDGPFWLIWLNGA